MRSEGNKTKIHMKENLTTSPQFTGTQVNYYFVCHRKLWLLSRGIRMEQVSDTVFLGKILSEQSYDRRRKEIDIDGTIVLDGFDPVHKKIYEVKKSKSVKQAHIWQTKYYLYFLKQLGVEATAEISYPLLRKIERFELTDEDEEELQSIFNGISDVINSEKIPSIKKKTFCRKCAYFEFCWG